ncbi:hypothetical protein BJV74DRAFT_335109 [Russula compacta]|nr:hypothetical protein BJV74DRAFT_335109 [Russula compacta]
MTPKTSVRECPICLDKFRNPVVTPCGHLTCDACIKSHAHNSSDPYEVTCPTCRAPFPIVTPHLSLVPKKFHIFISPPLRRVFLGEEEDSSRAVIESLNAEIAALKASVGTLKREKDLLMDRCESAQSAVARLTSYERAARLARDEAKEEARLANRDLEELRVEHDKLQSR